MKHDLAIKVLIVEDEGITGLQLKKTLTKAGYNVTAVAASADEALLAIEVCPPDLILMDIHIQGTRDGVETAYEIRRRFQLPVIFVTAHADSATLERARDSEPFGYIVKPISMLTLLSSIEMALHKHAIESRLAEHRAWLSTVLQTIPEAVIVTDINGNVEFLNNVGESLTGRKQSDVLGEDVSSFVQLNRGVNGDVTAELLQGALLRGETVQVPKETFLRCGTGLSVPVEGEVAISYVGKKQAGAIFTLRDASIRDKEDQKCRQEQKMIAVGQLASDIAGNFYGLLSVISDCSAQIAGSMEHAAQADLLSNLQHASTMCMLMSEQLVKLGDQQLLRPEVANLNRIITTIKPVLRGLCGDSIALQLHLSPEPTSVLCHPSHLEQILLNVLSNAKARLTGSGKIRIVTEVVQGTQEHVRIRFQLEHSGSSRWIPLGFPLEMESPELSLSVATAIITAAEGVVRFVKTSETTGEIEILLPRQQASTETAAAFDSRRGTVLIVGADNNSAGIIERQIEASSYVAISTPSASEALLVAQLGDGRIDLVIADGEHVSEHNCARLQKIFTGLNPNTKFLYCGYDEPRKNSSWSQLAKPFRARDVTEAVNALLTDVRSESKAAHV